MKGQWYMKKSKYKNAITYHFGGDKLWERLSVGAGGRGTILLLILFYFYFIALLFNNYCIIFHTNHHRLTFEPPVFIKREKNTTCHNETSVKTEEWLKYVRFLKGMHKQAKSCELFGGNGFNKKTSGPVS